MTPTNPRFVSCTPVISRVHVRGMSSGNRCLMRKSQMGPTVSITAGWRYIR